MTDLNRRPTDYKSVALPTELIRQEYKLVILKYINLKKIKYNLCFSYILNFIKIRN